MVFMAGYQNHSANAMGSFKGKRSILITRKDG